MSGLIRPVILSGGSGTRLWPLSTPDCPKQFHALAGPDTLLQSTLKRFADLSIYESPTLVLNCAHLYLAEQQAASAPVAIGGMIAEPVGRNTAMAVAVAALCLRPDEMAAFVPSDHHIGDEAAFHQAISQAARVAESTGRIVTLGIVPDRIEPGFGHIFPDAALGVDGANVEAFIEKPGTAHAETLVARGCLWNAGIFVCRAGDMLREIDAHVPQTAALARASHIAARQQGATFHPAPDAYAASPAISIDHGVMQKSAMVSVVGLDAGWSDLGSWDAIFDALPKDDAGNATVGIVKSDGNSNCLLYAAAGPIDVSGLDGFHVVTAPAGTWIGRNARMIRK